MNPDHAAWDTLQLLREQMKSFFKQREDLVDGALVALLAGVHLLVVGPPGTAKSMLAETLCRRLERATFFYYLLNKFTTWKELACGPAIVREVDHEGGRSISFRNTEGAMLRAQIVFWDEVFKAAGATLNSALSFMQERTCSINAGEVLSVPVVTIFAASNEMPGKEEEQLRAFADRFLLRYEVHYLSVSQDGDTAFLDMMADRQPVPDCALTVEQLRYFQREAARVPISDAMLGLINAIRATLLLQHGVQPSDRRYMEARKVLRAFAYLNGHAEVEVNDLAVLEHVLWTSRDSREREAVRMVTAETMRTPQLVEAVQLVKEAEAVHARSVDSLRQAGAALPFDDHGRSAVEGWLDDALAGERRLEQIHHVLGRLPSASDPAILPTLRTYQNQVNVFRKNLVRLRGVENPFVETSGWTTPVA